MFSTDMFAALDVVFADAKTPQQAFSVTCRLAGELGFEHVIYAPVRNHPDATKNWTATSYPKSWQEIYVAKSYISRNPVRYRSIIGSTPFLWSSLENELADSDRELFRVCRECGMRDGYVVPVHGAWGQSVAIGFACQSPDAIANPGKSGLQLLAYKLNHCFDLIPRTLSHVTERERQVLILLAQGKTSPEIADEMSISDNSVEWHLKNIYRKLEVNSRTAAVIKAIQFGFLEI